MAASKAPTGFPTGPVQGNTAHLIDEVKSFTSTRPDGSWGVRKGGSIPTNSKRFFTQRVTCSKYDSCGCKWECAYEETSGGWVLTNYAVHDGEDKKPNGHNHELDSSAAEVMAHRSGQFIPTQLLELASQMATGQNTAASIHSTLVSNAHKLGLPVTWERNTVYDWYVRHRTSDNFDVTGLLEMLKEREEREGYASKFALQPNSEGEYVLRRVCTHPHPSATLSDGSVEFIRHAHPCAAPSGGDLRFV